MYWAISLVSLILVSHGSILKNVSLPSIEYASYNSTEKLLQIDCADEWVTSLPGFLAMEKFWTKDTDINFSTTNIVFLDNNQSIEFSRLQPADSGNYACCARNFGEVEYYCSNRNVVVTQSVDGPTRILDTSANISQEFDGTVRTVQLMDNDVLNAQDAHMYLLKLFHDNATNVHCTLDGYEAPVETKLDISDSSLPVHFDVLIRSFNATLHSGYYSCNGTYQNGNETEIAEVNFKATESEEPNSHEEQLDEGVLMKLRRNPSKKILMNVVSLVAIVIIL
ncbi:hypothetical protein GCK32_005003 [Trichostrongylus colubriformis]|uniref:Ig-like domain-containing protein n=1 Tax=Trichostrongylus colubriformis TaxID=6319 RepID=A0AAN8FBW9_TRICO